MKIVFLDRSTLGEDIPLSFFNDLGEVVSYDITQPEQTINRLQDADVVVTNKVVINKEVMDKTSLKLICVSATGTNNIDMQYAQDKGIMVKNVAGYSTHSVAQVTLSLVLDFVQHLNYYKKYVNNQQWQISPIFTHIGQPFHEINNKKWGIIGLGTIGTQVATIAQAMGAKVCYYSTSGTNHNKEIPSCSLEELLSSCDIITIHAPLNDATLNLLNKENLPFLKEKSIVINVGRGGIINEEDLAQFIDTKEVYFGLDVVSREPIEANNPLLTIQHKERLTITPHVAWSSIEAREALVKMVYNNIAEFKKAHV
ncbi:D-2-hydroxyacid dehydrogenase [Candidatus Marinarcus aquaticus]|uniref:Hydroxyacid dehydrogenase n=1 Tax=Candidatus Marinarcus aquaticus TaxID=2044504 RepID=A0A4Q0XU94_9BACT|nr:D-2-hydroxyacid dehydrogenase [Candidatus Marinarcus aquaticus]RXJ57991.1 hydroxyacid dehydrogenase [Candidatus Marinarcus aquaticus]